MKIDWEQVAVMICLVTGLVQCHAQDQATAQQKAEIEFQRERFEAEMNLKRLEMNIKQENENEQKITP